jgi:GMP synthase (glutamine-hydrolysing)
MSAKGEYSDLKVYVIDNGGQWTHREWRVLKYLGVQTKILENDTTWAEIEEAGLDGILLSGGAPRVGVEGTLGKCGEILDRAPYPVLGICAGHQFMARHFGGDAAPGEGEFGATELQVLPHEDPDILKDVPEKSQVWESHHDEVTRVPEGFEVLARSERCGIQVMRHATKRLYGMQFHPEVEHSEHGVQMFQNFLEICRIAKSERVTQPQ